MGFAVGIAFGVCASEARLDRPLSHPGVFVRVRSAVGFEVLSMWKIVTQGSPSGLGQDGGRGTVACEV